MKNQGRVERAVSQLEAAVNRNRDSRETFRSYKTHLTGYISFITETLTDAKEQSTEEKVSAYLDTLSEKSASNQKQALHALVYFYKHVIQKPIGILPKWDYAKPSKKLPTWLTPDECIQLFRHMEGLPRLMAEIMFGSGLRLKEAVKLRIQDVDPVNMTIKVRSGKGGKWRVTCLPKTLAPVVVEHLKTCREIFESDRAKGINPTKLPEGLERKFPNGGNDFAWFWFFPAKSLCRSTDYRDRWHIHEGTIGKALSVARKLADLGKRVSAHTLRHSFATAALGAGMPIHELKDLMGHVSIKTTEIYLHCLPLLASRSQSPLDAAMNGDPKKVVPFPIDVDSSPEQRYGTFST